MDDQRVSVFSAKQLSSMKTDSLINLLLEARSNSSANTSKLLPSFQEESNDNCSITSLSIEPLKDIIHDCVVQNTASLLQRIDHLETRTKNLEDEISQLKKLGSEPHPEELKKSLDDCIGRTKLYSDMFKDSGANEATVLRRINIQHAEQHNRRNDLIISGVCVLNDGLVQESIATVKELGKDINMNLTK